MGDSADDKVSSSSAAMLIEQNNELFTEVQDLKAQVQALTKQVQKIEQVHKTYSVAIDGYANEIQERATAIVNAALGEQLDEAVDAPALAPATEQELLQLLV